jgi:hypothetical protein
MPHEFEGSCVQCLEDRHCGADGDCAEGTHTCAGGDACGGACGAPYPGCVVVNGVPSCVSCTSDAHCPGGACNTTTYGCEGGANDRGCAGDCLIAGCRSVSGQFTLACDPESGCCYDTTGLCDDVEAFCKTASGSECQSIFEIFMGGAIPGGGLPGMEGAFVGGLCTCDAATMPPEPWLRCAQWLTRGLGLGILSAMNEPLSRAEAKALLQKILEGGTVTYSVPHALDRLRKRGLSTIDCENVLRGGVVEEAEWENGCWRHRVRTRRITIVVQCLSEEEVLVVTAWRTE